MRLFAECGIQIRVYLNVQNLLGRGGWQSFRPHGGWFFEGTRLCSLLDGQEPGQHDFERLGQNTSQTQKYKAI